MARYSFTYCSAPTGYGWAKETNNLGEIKRFICDVNKETVSAAFSVWDYEKHAFVYDKEAFEYKPRIDKIF